MPGGFPSGWEHANQAYLGQFGPGTNVAYDWPTNPTGTNTKSAWYQLTASAPFDICWLQFFFLIYESATAGVTVAIDIGVGASGSEQIIASNICLATPTNYADTYDVGIPVQIPAGSRVAVRYQETTTAVATPLAMNCTAYDGGFYQMEGCAGVDGIGVTVSGNTVSTAYTPGANGATGAWTQIIASTARDYYGLSVICDNQMAIDTNYPFCLTDIGIGASGSEKVIIASVFWAQQHQLVTKMTPMQIPAGSRLSVRGSISAAIGGTPKYGCSLLGAY